MTAGTNVKTFEPKPTRKEMKLLKWLISELPYKPGWKTVANFEEEEGKNRYYLMMWLRLRSWKD